MTATSAGRARPQRGPQRLRHDDGAVIVEFALIAPLLFLIVFAIIEFGAAYGQSLDVKQGAREAARLAAVNYQPDPSHTGSAQLADMGAAACDRMQFTGGSDITFSLPSTTDPTSIGSIARVTVTRPVKQVTGFLAFALDGRVLQSTVETRLEQDATWTAGSYSCS